METLEKSRMCRLCGKKSGISIDIFDKNENHVQKINAILPILVHEMDLLPKQMCHRCSYKLEEFYNFYEDCAKTDTELKNQLSWMRKENLEEKIVTPMVKMNPFKIKTEPPDHNGSIDPNNTNGHMNQSSLIFPASILQHSFHQSTSPLLTCSTCQCLCNKSVKVNKTSPKDVKILPLESGDQAHSSNIASNIRKNLSDKSESMSVDKNVSCKKSLFEENTSRTKTSKHIPVVSLESNGCIKSGDLFETNPVGSEKLDRALRPRKGSVDYLGPKKKGVVNNLKSRLKNNLDMLDPTMVNPVDIKISYGTSAHPSPIIKLEKVDNTMKTLRAQKNLETFNKRIREIKKGLQRRENHNKSVWRPEYRTKNLPREKIQDENSVEIGSPCTSNLKKEDDQRKKSVQVEENRNHEKILDLNEKTECSLNIVRCKELEIKQESVGGIIDVPLKENPDPESTKASSSKNQKVTKLLDRYALCTVVKLEKDYTCNVDYPRIKIKRQLAIASSPRLQDASDVKTKSTTLLSAEAKKLPCNEDHNYPPKVLRSKKKRPRSSDGKKTFFHPKRRKSKQLGSVVKQTALEKSSSVNTYQTDFKRYCEQCDTSFRNKELYRLHPCYQN